MDTKERLLTCMDYIERNEKEYNFCNKINSGNSLKYFYLLQRWYKMYAYYNKKYYE